MAGASRSSGGRLALVELYREAGDPKYERAAVRWLPQYALDQEPTLEELGERVAQLSR